MCSLAWQSPFILMALLLPMVFYGLCQARITEVAWACLKDLNTLKAKYLCIASQATCFFTLTPSGTLPRALQLMELLVCDDISVALGMLGSSVSHRISLSIKNSTRTPLVDAEMHSSLVDNLDDLY
mmetsp:Transcript_47567/g.90792  ORF Transcript_47567/g.90792 Transcript_47567/m.90792 type:complete len:126 (+) Transcript_47567:629-1006(+)